MKTEARNERILVILAILSVGGSIAGAMAVNARFGLAVLVGCVFAFVNYFWMRRSLAKIFSTAAAEVACLEVAGLFGKAKSIHGVVITAVRLTQLYSVRMPIRLSPTSLS